MASTTGAAATRSRVVIVGDPDWDTRAILARALEHAGYGVHTADDGNSLLDAAAEHPADLVIAELYMRSRSGPCTVQCLKRDALLRRVPILVYTSRVLPADEEWARNVGAEGYLRKPAPLDAVLAAVEGLATAGEEKERRRSRPGRGNGAPPRENGESPRA